MWDDVVNAVIHGDFLLALFKAIMAILIGIVNIILYPFSLIIANLIPSLDNGLQMLASYFDYASQFMGWILNAFAVPTLAITLVASYYLFAFTATFYTWTVKLIIRWKQVLWG